MLNSANVIMVDGVATDIVYGDPLAARQIAIEKYGDPANEGPDGNLDMVTPLGATISIQKAPVVEDNLEDRIDNLQEVLFELRHAVKANDKSRAAYWGSQLLHENTSVVAEVMKDAVYHIMYLKNIAGRL